jgi:two-component system C4-dicarboxylate transport response regulator DctD
MDLSLNVLIVEDDHAMAQMCAKLIRRRGHFPIIAGSGQDALQILQIGRNVDAVISDIQMPQMSGIELLAQVRDINAQIPVILMTGYTNVVSATEAVSLGAADNLSKPFDSETLIGSLERSFLKRVPEHA